MSAWKKLAEAFGIETEAGWDKVAKQRNMQRYGTQDRNTQPQSAFNVRGTGSAQRQATAAGATPNMTPRPGGLQIPMGADKPGQLNALYAQPQRPQSPLATPSNAPRPSMGMTGEPEPRTDDDERNPGDNPGGRI